MKRKWLIGAAAILMTSLVSGVFAPAPVAAAAETSRAEHLFEQGLQLARANKTDEAIAVFKQLTRDYPRLPEPHVQLAAMYGRSGNLHGAIASLQSALRLQGDNAQWQEQLGDLYVQLAARAYAAASERNPSRTSAQRKHSALETLQAPN